MWVIHLAELVKIDPKIPMWSCQYQHDAWIRIALKNVSLDELTSCLQLEWPSGVGSVDYRSLQQLLTLWSGR